MTPTKLSLPTIDPVQEKRFQNIAWAYHVSDSFVSEETLKEMETIFNSSYLNYSIRFIDIFANFVVPHPGHADDYDGRFTNKPDDFIIHKWVVTEAHYDYNFLIYGKRHNGHPWESLKKSKTLDILINDLNNSGYLLKDLTAVDLNTGKQTRIECERIVKYSL